VYKKLQLEDSFYETSKRLPLYADAAPAVSVRAREKKRNLFYETVTHYRRKFQSCI
jgi:hypothetical protein